MGASAPALVIVLGNEKGGVGKSTIAANLAIGLARSGLSVAAVDLDGRQRTLARWLDTRTATSEALAAALAMPARAVIAPSIHDSASLNEERDFAALAAALERLDTSADVIVIDTAAGDSYLARLAHALADIVLTPVHDSPVDLDALLRTGEGGPSSYLAMVKDARAARIAAGDVSLDWIIVRARRLLQPAPAGNSAVLDAAVRDHGFRLLDGPCERAIYRDGFASGLSVYDVLPGPAHRRSHAAASARVGARAEIEALIAALYLPFPVAPGGDGARAGGLRAG